MSSHEMMDQAALYALDALSGTELAEFESHLDGCHRCRAELVMYQSVAADLVYDDGAPSERTWQRISASIAAEPQTSVAEVVPLHRPQESRFTAGRWVASIAAVAALVLGGLLTAQLLTGSGLTDQNITAAADAAATEPGSIVGDFVVDGVQVAHVVLARDGRGFVVPTEDLEPLDPSRTYQLWVINDTSAAISAGVLGADPGPATFTWTGGVSGFALTRESAGGVVSSAGDVVSVIEDVT